MSSGPHTGGIAWNNVVGSVGTDLSGTRTIIHNPNVEGVGEVSH